MAATEDTSRVVEVDGVLIRVHSGRPTQADVASLSVILQAAERRMDLRRRAAPTTQGEK